MVKFQFAGLVAALTLSAVSIGALVIGSATAPEFRGNPAVQEEVYTASRSAEPAAPSPLRHAVA